MLQEVGELEFGRFRLDRRARTLVADGARVALGGRAFDLLLALIDANGALVRKDDLLARVWPDTLAEENNLQVQVLALRRALGADRDLIRTVPKHGYRFMGRVVRSAFGTVEVTPPSGGNGAIRRNNLPAPVVELVGRETDLLQLIALHRANRLLTLTGPEGIGKTSLALSAARRLLPNYPDGVWLVELAALSEPELIPAAVASALDLRRLALPLTPERIAAAIGSRQLLLVIDNCEHVIEIAARTTEALLQGATGVRRIIALRSREPPSHIARAQCVFQVPPLESPQPGLGDTALLARHAAVHLFLTRAQASGARLEREAGVVATIAEICRRLDGIPLAIELAAACAMTLGVDGVAAGLDDRFHLLTSGRRTALPRQQTLRATFDWSFELLTARERATLSRLGVFIGTFTLEAATYVIADIFGSPFEAADGIAGLVSKSLVGIEGAGGAVRYRMLETVRLYVLERLDASALRSVQRRHLAFYQLLMQRAAAAWEASETDEWLAEYGADIDNVRAALQWGFSPTGDASLSAALAAAATPLWRELSLHSECRRWAELALGTSDTPGTARELALLIAYGSTLLNTGGDDARVEAMLRRALSLAETLKQQEYILRAGYSLWVHFLHRNDYRTAFNQAAQFRVNARRASDLTDMLIGNRMVGATLHYLGRQGAARWWLERALRQPMAAAQRSREARFGVDQRVAALTATARVRAGNADRR